MTPEQVVRGQLGADLAAAGNLVMTERVDHFIYDGHEVDARVAGVFEVDGDKITAWRGYYDVP